MNSIIPITTALFLVTGGLSVTAASANTPTSTAKKSDGDRTIKGGENGSTLESMTIEGEDKIRIDFRRPTLKLDIDPSSAPGLDWDVVWSLLVPAELDLYRPLSERSEHLHSSYRARPWLNEFREGEIVRFHTDIDGASSWTMTVMNSRGETVSKFGGDDNPPKQIGWDGRTLSGDPASPGLRYSFVLEAADRAGNKRRFVGDGFELPAYLVESESGTTFHFAGSNANGADGIAAPVVLDVASRINQGQSTATVTITVTAPDFKSANARGESIASDLRPLLLGDPSRVRVVANVHKGVPETGSVSIAVQPGTKKSS